jgi:hypothetical protein
MRTTMRALARITLTLAAALLVAAPGYSFDLSRMLGGGEQQDLNTFRLIHIADLKAMLAANTRSVHVYDANGPETREKFGIIPSAALLSSDNNYDLSILPRGKASKLVFYCANAH